MLNVFLRRLKLTGLVQILPCLREIELLQCCCCFCVTAGQIKRAELCFVSVTVCLSNSRHIFKLTVKMLRRNTCSDPVVLDLSASGQRVNSAEFLNLSLCRLLFGLHRYQRCLFCLSPAALSDQDHFHSSALLCSPQNTENTTGNKHNCTVCPPKYIIHLSEFTVKTFTFL